MYNPLLPQVHQPTNHLGDEVPRLDLGNGLALLEHVAEAL